MKNTIRVHHHGGKKNTSSQGKILTCNNEILESELREIAAFWPADRRCSMALKFKRWAEQLEASCHQIETSQNFGAAEAAKQAPKIPKGFVFINLGEREKKEMRQIAQEHGLELRGVLRNAVLDMYYRLKDASRIKHLTGWDWPTQSHRLGLKNKIN